MKIAVAQLNPTVGDLDGNFNKLLDAYKEAAANGADLMVAPECVMTGYPLEDLVLRQSFLDATEAKNEAFVAAVRALNLWTAVIFGTVGMGCDDDMPRNEAWLVDPTDNSADNRVQKVELPNYGVFDEKRIFAPGGQPYPLNFRKTTIGLMICEDCWFPRVSRELRDGNANLLIAINGSPFEMGKNVTRRKVVAKRIAETGLPFLYVNLVGGQDELVFDGGSFFYDGQRIQEAPEFVEGVFYFNYAAEFVVRYKEGDEVIAHTNDAGDNTHWIREPKPLVTLENYPEVAPSGLVSIYTCLVMGLRDYMRKQGFKSVVLGYSGGVDSGLVAAVAADAIGPENVHLVRLPSRYSSQHSLDDAAAGAARLGAKMRTINIEPVVEALRVAYERSDNHGFYPQFEGDDPQAGWLTGVADENIQARARGNILMAISNQEGHLLLTTGNKSEVSVGYATLYGDMSGGYNPIKDCYKTTVWALCRWRNGLNLPVFVRDHGFLGNATAVVPEEIIVKPPSAELRPDQKDEDSLPPYPVLDAILKGMIEDEKSVLDLIEEGVAEEPVIRRVRNLIDGAEYKRRQAAPGVKITSKIHGRDRRYPIVNKWRS